MTVRSRHLILQARHQKARQPAELSTVEALWLVLMVVVLALLFSTIASFALETFLKAVR